MTRSRLAGMPGVDPAWSREVEVADATGARHLWHLLDTGDSAGPTLLCVHGNPTWSYLWRRFVEAAPDGWRVVAVDQLGMGYSDRTAAPRTLAQRVDDLGRLTDAIGITGPVVTLAHDWGGPISLGWALAHRHQLRGVVLANTAVAQPSGDAGPALIRLARSRALRRLSCARTAVFVRAATALSRPPLPRDVRDAFAAPYRSAQRRQAVADFVADIPFEPDHPSASALRSIADRLPALRSVPVLLLWGPRDPVFGERYLRDLLRRLPQAQVQRYEGASHLVTEDRPESAQHVWRWVTDVVGIGDPTGHPVEGHPSAQPVDGAPDAAAAPTPAAPPIPVWRLPRHDAAAVVELGVRGRRVSFTDLSRRVDALAAGLAASGVRAGDRVALLVPPGADLTLAVYGCWRAGAVVVLADAGLGVRALGRALRGAGPDHVIGVARGLAAAAALRVPGRRILVGPAPAGSPRVLGVSHTLAGLVRSGASAPLPAEPSADAECTVLFTSGATGPAKGVVYRHRQVSAQMAALRTAYGIGDQDRLVAAFAPFALYGPALGVASAVPDMDVTAPGTLTASALADAVAAVDGTVVFASPAALRNVVATASGLDAARREALEGVRLVLSAGAPVPASLLRAVARVLPAAEAHTPYGMTEALPVADITLRQIEDAGHGEGVCVGTPLPGVEVRVGPLSPDGSADRPLTGQPGVVGEVCVRACHVKERYDRLWATEQASSRNPGWHRTGDVGHLDDQRRLWVEGRLVHVVTTASGVVTPVGVEQRVQALPTLQAAAAVGVGPTGTQQVVVVVVPEDSRGHRRRVLAGRDTAAAVRQAAGVPVAAVLVAPRLPVDIRHQSKVDRARVSRWASRVLAGERPGRLR